MEGRRRACRPGISDGYHNKRLAGKAIRKNMKTKHGQNRDWLLVIGEDRHTDIPHPGAFA
jgi:hypothetical protein